MDLKRSSSHSLPLLWSLYVSITFTLIISVSSAGLDPPGTEQPSKLGPHLKTAALITPPTTKPAAQANAPEPSPSSVAPAAEQGPLPSTREPTTTKPPGPLPSSTLEPTTTKPPGPLPSTHEPTAKPPGPLPSTPGPITKPAEPVPSTPKPTTKPAEPLPSSTSEPPKPSSGTPRTSPGSNTIRKTKTPPPPPDEYMKGDPLAMRDFFEQTFGDQRLQFYENGTTKLSLDQYSGSGFKSKNEYLFITMTIQMKLVPGNSAGSVTTFYLTSSGFGHDEIDIEFLGNATGEPYTMHTNVYVDGKGSREQQFHLWFDPTQDFHTYTLSWTAKRIAWFVDGIPIRQYKSDPASGVPYPSKKAQRIIASLWNADDWATQGGKVKADWSHGPLIAYYKNFTSAFCLWNGATSSCGITPTADPKLAWLNEEFDDKGLEKIKWSQENIMIYNYCNDPNRFMAQGGLPKECAINK